MWTVKSEGWCVVDQLPRRPPTAPLTLDSHAVSPSVCLLSCIQICNPMDCSPPGSSVHGILQARILEGVAIPFFRGSSPPRDRTHIFCRSWTADRFFTIWATREAVLGGLEQQTRDFPGGPVVKTSPSNAESVGSIPGWGAKIQHALWPKKPKHKTKAIL